MTLSIDAAVLAVRSVQVDDVIDARQFAENLGYAALRTGAPMPAAFEGVLVLSEGFLEGRANARCERELVRAGLA